MTYQSRFHTVSCGSQTGCTEEFTLLKAFWSKSFPVQSEHFIKEKRDRTQEREEF